MAVGAELLDDPLGVERVVENDGVDDQAERAELFFLAFAVGLAQLAPAAVEDVRAEVVAAFAAVELTDDRPTVVRVVAVVEEVDRLRDSSDVRERPGERREMAGLAAERAYELAAVVWRWSRLPAILSTSS